MTCVCVCSMLQGLVDFDGYYLESDPCLVCNNPEVAYTVSTLLGGDSVCVLGGGGALGVWVVFLSGGVLCDHLLVVTLSGLIVSALMLPQMGG